MTAPKPPPQEMWAVVLDGERMPVVRPERQWCEDAVVSDYGRRILERLTAEGRLRIVRVRVEVIDE